MQDVYKRQEQFDGVRVEEFRVSQAAIAEAIVNVDDKTARCLLYTSRCV